MQLHNRSERHRELFFAGLGVFLMLGLGLTAPPARQDAGQGKTPTTNAQAAARQADQAALPETERVYYDVPDEEGRLSGGFVLLPRPDISNVEKSLTSTYTTILNNGPSSNRIDIVFVGDGYLAAELGTYATHTLNGLNALLAEEPFFTYSTFFNVHRVDVVSIESGVDNDPTNGISRNTAMDMAFWCSGIERLLCINVTKAYSFANAAPDVDQVLAIANSTKYGGAGYGSSELATYSGGNGSATELALHEFGHSLGDLADEYDYNDGAVYTGPEPPDRNASIYEAATMLASGDKWADWLGDPGIGFGGTVGTYEGCLYKQYGIYRPTSNSLMRTLGQPFNLPSIEALIIEFYKIVTPIDDSTPTGSTLNGSETIFVDPLDPVGHSLDVEWLLDGVTIAGATGTTLNLSTVVIGPGVHTLTATVTDNTTLVRDDSARSIWMSESRTWSVDPSLLGDANGDGFINVTDLLLLLGAWGPCPVPCPPSCAADFNGNCQVNVTDLLGLLSNWGP